MNIKLKTSTQVEDSVVQIEIQYLPICEIYIEIIAQNDIEPTLRPSKTIYIFMVKSDPNNMMVFTNLCHDAGRQRAPLSSSIMYISRSQRNNLKPTDTFIVYSCYAKTLTRILLIGHNSDTHFIKPIKTHICVRALICQYQYIFYVYLFITQRIGILTCITIYR